MLHFLFCFIGIAVMIWRLLWVLSPKSEFERYKKWKTRQEANEGKSYDEMDEDYRGVMVVKTIWYILAAIWTISGLFTFQWQLFIIYIVIKTAVMAPILKAVDGSKAYVFAGWLFSLFVVLFTLFVVMNAAHLHIKIDLLHYIGIHI